MYLKNILQSTKIQPIRNLIQFLFILLLVWIGIEFFIFIRFLETNGQSTFISRPPGVDGFLPIASLMNFLYFIKTGQVHPVHPSGFFIFVSILLMSLIFGKSFCSWLCPVGSLSEQLANLGQKIFKRKIKIFKVPDTILRSLKYLLLAFFGMFIFPMTAMELKGFLDGSYNMVADIQMYYFFANISFVSFIVIAVLFILSIFFRGFWCRYLCPYGALLGILSLLSPFKIRRNTESCINCAKCAKVCPSFIKVDKVKMVISDECTSCMQCVDVCPVKNTLEIKAPVKNKTINKKMVAIVVVVVFLAVTGLGMILGKWQNNVSKEKYLELYPIRNEFKHH